MSTAEFEERLLERINDEYKSLCKALIGSAGANPIADAVKRGGINILQKLPQWIKETHREINQDKGFREEPHIDDDAQEDNQ